jgi:hypothetical protein
MTITPQSNPVDGFNKVTSTAPQVLSSGVPIAAGASLSSDFVDLGTSRLFAVWVPPGFSGGALTFRSSPDGVTFGELYDDTGAEVTVTVASAGTMIVMSLPSKWLGIRYLYLRSGTAASPVAQAAGQQLVLFSLP